MSMFRGKTIGLIWDKHSSHYSAEVEEFVEKCNADKATDTRIVLELVDEGLTPIIQVPDVAVNKVFKAAVKEKYHAYRSGLQVAIGKKISVPREKMVEFVLEAIAEINEQNNESQFIRDAFKRCGRIMQQPKQQTLTNCSTIYSIQDLHQRNYQISTP